MAGTPPPLGKLPPEQRRRWVVAAAVTGAMMTSQVAVRDENLLLGELPSSLREVADADLMLLGSAAETRRSLTVAAPQPGVAAPVAARPVGASAGTGSGGEGALPDGTVEIARAGDVAVVTEGASVELVGFHESSSADAIALDSALPLASAHAEVESDSPDEEGPVVALPTRHRAGAPTSAVDIAMTPGHEVLAPVSGEVIAVDEYALYGSTEDVVVQIRAEADPDVVVTIVHVAGQTVEVGDRVEAGRTPIAAEARQLPFESQIDRFTEDHRGAAAPHVHIELAHA